MMLVLRVVSRTAVQVFDMHSARLTICTFVRGNLVDLLIASIMELVLCIY